MSLRYFLEPNIWHASSATILRSHSAQTALSLDHVLTHQHHKHSNMSGTEIYAIIIGIIAIFLAAVGATEGFRFL